MVSNNELVQNRFNKINELIEVLKIELDEIKIIMELPGIHSRIFDIDKENEFTIKIEGSFLTLDDLQLLWCNSSIFKIEQDMEEINRSIEYINIQYYEYQKNFRLDDIIKKLKEDF